MKEYMVIEDNGGGLTLVVFAADGETIEYIHSGYEYNPGQLTDDLKALENGDDPAKDWDGNALDDLEITAEMANPEDLESWFPWNQKGVGWETVADNGGIYPEDMGAAARAEFGIFVTCGPECRAEYSRRNHTGYTYKGWRVIPTEYDIQKNNGLKN